MKVGSNFIHYFIIARLGDGEMRNDLGKFTAIGKCIRENLGDGLGKQPERCGGYWSKIKEVWEATRFH